MKTNSPSTSILGQLLGTRAGLEGSVSNAFAACFRESTAFREAILRLLWRVCRIRSARPICGWDCHREVVIDPHSRPDFHIQPAGNASGPLFRIENKVGARLTKGQLERYRLNEEGEYLIAVTKRAPEVESAWLRRNRIFAMRWQDVHRALSDVSARGTDAYLCRSFRTYLEELRMAHREDIRAEDLKRVAKLFERITASHDMGLGAEDAFRLAADCLAELDEVLAAAIDVAPKLRTFSRCGPNYWKEVGTDGDEPRHLLLFHLHTGKRKWHTSCGAGFAFRANGKPPKWVVTGKIRGKPERDFSNRIESVCRDGVLDKQKMLDSFLRGAKRIGVIG